MRVLVTGSAGFIGGYFARRLSATGHDVIGIDIKELIDCRDFFRHNSETFDLVVHCAANVGGRAMIEHNPLWVAENFSIDTELFSWARRTDPAHIVYFSSSAVYPPGLQAPIYRLHESDVDLDRIQNPDAVYGWTKLVGEKLASLAAEDGVRVHVFRPFSGYGEEQSVAYPFPSFIARALRRADPFEIWGDGYQTRDWIHVEDIYGAVLAAIEADISGPVNLGTGIATDFRTLAGLICNAVGYHPDYAYQDDMPSGVYYRVADPALFSKFYDPKVDLREGIARALNV